MSAALGLLIWLALGQRVPPAFGIAVTALAFVALALISCRLCSACVCRPETVVDVLREVVEGPEDAEEPRSIAGFDKSVRASILNLQERVRSLRRARRWTEVALTNMADGIIAVDPEGTVTLFSKAAGHMFGVKSSEMPGRKLIELDLHPEIARVAAECVSDRTVLTSEIRLPGLPERVISIRAAAFRGPSGREDCAMIVLRDLSEIRRHEKQQREFVSNVSHELRTPITSVRATAEALLAGARKDDDLVDCFLNTIVSESVRLSTLIEDLMDIAKRDSGITRIERADVDVAAVVERAVAVVRPHAVEKEVRLDVEVPDRLTGYCDQTQIAQLVQNLLDNAVKYTPAGGRVAVSARREDSKLLICVKDTGIGIPQGEVDRIFERFYRVDKARSRRLGGTGLGLSIVKNIVESHNGEIIVDTQLGKGSTFTVKLPDRQAEE